MKRSILSIALAAMLASSSFVSVSAYSNENNVRTWDFETIHDVAFQWADVRFSKGSGYKWDQHPGGNGDATVVTTNDRASTKPVIGAWQRAQENSDVARYYPTIRDYTYESLSEATVSIGQGVSIKELGVSEGGGSRCIQFGKLNNTNASSLAMKMYLSDKDVVPGQKYKISFQASGNKNVYTWDAETSSAVATTAEYSGLRFYTAFHRKNMDFITNGSSEELIKRNTLWLNGDWTENGNIKSAPLLVDWNTYELIITPSENDFRDGVISLWIGVAGEYDAVLQRYPFLPTDFTSICFDNIKITPVNDGKTSAVIKYGINWSFDDVSSMDFETTSGVLTNSKWTSSAEYMNPSKHGCMTSEYLIPHYVSVDNVEYKNPLTASDIDTSVVKAAGAAHSKKCAEMYLPKKKEEGNDGIASSSLVGLGMQTLLSDKQIKAGETYKLSFYAKTNASTYDMFATFTTTENPYLASSKGDKRIPVWLGDRDDKRFAGTAGKSWQRFTITLTPTEEDFDENGNIKLWIISSTYRTTNKTTQNMQYGEKLYIDDVSLVPTNAPVLTVGETVNLHIDVTNYQGLDDSMIIAALYDDNRLIGANISNGDNDVYVGRSFTLAAPEDAVDISAKLFVWDKTSITPLTEYFPIGQ